ncbi:MAG TPA: hypothetical protein VG455_05030 [Acidimicrobiales bacterium]|nr:hypothetical protein [Acidimicrobiales bacterium]
MKLPSRLRRRTAALATIGVLALAMAACGSSDEEGSGSGSTRAATNTGGPQAEFLTLKGTSTSVDLDPGTAKVLADNHVTVTPVAPASVSQSGGTTTVSFPITQGFVSVYPTTQPSYIRGTFSHSGGLTFAAGGKSLQVTDFIVNPGTSTLSATVGGPGGSVAQILDLDGSNVQVTQDAQGNTRLDGTVAKLSATGADALNKTFGVSLFEAGIPLGVVHVVANGTPGPMGAPEAEFVRLSGTSTSVDLDAATAKVLADNKVSVAPVGPATASASGGTTTVSFPITEGYVAVYPSDQPNYIRGTFSHSGGLKFTAGGKSLEVTDFIVNPGDSTLSATVSGSGAVAHIMDLDGTDVKVSQDSQGRTLLDGTVAKLSTTGAEALNKTFGVSLFKAGIPLGVVHVVATGDPVAQP